MRITYSDARRGAKQADLCGDCAGTMPGQPAARRGRKPKSATTPDVVPLFAAPSGTQRRRQDAALRWSGAAQSDRGARERGQGRASARPLSRRPRTGAGAHRAEPVGRRVRLARADRAAGRPCSAGSIDTFDDVFERIAFAGGARAPGRLEGAARAARPPRARRGAARRPRRLGALRRLRRRAAADARGARVRAARPRTSSRAISPRSTPPTAPSSTGSASGIATCSAAARPSASSPTSTPGTASRSSRTASRTSPAREWALLEALAARTDVSVSLPYEPGRPAFTSLRRTAEDLQRLAAGRIEELPPRYAEVAQPALAHLERALFADEAHEPGRDRRRRALLRRRRRARRARARRRGAARAPARGHAGRERSASSARASTGCALRSRRRFGTLGIPYAVDGEVRLAQTPFGQALVSLLRFAWLGGSRGDLFTFLRSPFSGVERRAVDFVEGRLRGRAVQAPERVVEEGEKLHGRAVPRARRAPRRRRPARGGARARGADAAQRLRARGAAGRRGVAARPARLRDAEPPAHRARALAHARRRALARRRRVGARAPDAAPAARRRARTRRRRRPAARAHAPLRRRLRARSRGRQPAAARLVVAVPRRRRTAAARRARRAAAAARLR